MLALLKSGKAMPADKATADKLHADHLVRLFQLEKDKKISIFGPVTNALPWTSGLLDLKKRAENATAMKFNSCLLNLYHDGTEGMGWHSDDEKTLGINPAIASVSLGAPRKFLFRHKSTHEKVSVLLEDGSLLLMKDETQHFWLHSLPKTRKVMLPRINLTFRKFVQ